MKKDLLPTNPHCAAASLREVGLRATGPRLAILELLRHDSSHPTAEQVYQRLRPSHPGLSLSTVYNTLEAFSRRGLCRRMPPVGGSQRYDGTVEPHHHALCIRCGLIYDLAPEVYQPFPPPTQLQPGLRVRGVQITFEVICAHCRPLADGEGRAASNNDSPLDSHTQQGGVTCPS